MRAFVLILAVALQAKGFAPSASRWKNHSHQRCGSSPKTAGCTNSAGSSPAAALAASVTEDDDVAKNNWNGNVVPGDGQIRGCTTQQVEGTLTEWTIAIDGVEADLGRFSDAIYKKFIQDAKQQRFQGFRPGTIPPHLEPTYRAFAMDECARETVLEAMQQNNIRPFENCRSEMYLYNICIPPVPANKRTKTTRKEGKASSVDANTQDPVETGPASWRTFDTMKEAIDAGWKPGQSFSFLAKDVKGQQVKENSDTAGATSLGVNF